MEVSMATPNITPLAMAMSASKAQTEVGTAVLAKNLDSFEESGAAMVKMMEQSVSPHLGGNFDMSV